MNARRIVALVSLAVVTAALTGCDPAEAKRACVARGGRMVDELARVPQYATDAKGHLKFAGYRTEYQQKCRGAR